jgi:hypothetical protein
LGFTVHVLLSVSSDGISDEATREFPSWAEAVDAVSMIPDQLMSQGHGWNAITIIPTEHFPRLMQGAERQPDA